MKKLLSALLICLLLLSLFAGCSQPESDTADGEIIFIEDENVPLASNPYPEYTPIPTPESIPSQNALDLAMAHAGVSAGEIEDSSVNFRMDGTRPEYIVEFSAGTKDYWYKIHAHTGDILSYKRL